MVEGLVSIIVPCYNHAQYLPDALNSVLNQTYPNWECIVVNDASTDNTIEVATRFAQHDHRIQLINAEKNSGLAASRNLGIRKSVGTYLLPLDSDDRLHSTYLEKSLKAFNDHPSTKMVYTDVQCFGADNSIAIRPPFEINELCRQNKIHCTAMFRRDVFLQTDGYRENMKYGYEDWDFWLQLVEVKGEFTKIPEPLFFIRVKEASMYRELTEQPDKERAMRQQLKVNNFEVYRKYAPELLPDFKVTGWPKKLISYLKKVFKFKK